MKHLIGQTRNDIEVYVDLIQSQGAKHISQQPQLLTLAVEVLKRTSLEKSYVSLEYDMGRVVGYDFVVKTTPDNTIFYAQPLRDTVYTRFTKNVKPTSTKYVSIILERSQEGDSYNINDIRIGRLIPPRTGSNEETAQSKQYWENHAFIFDNQPIQSRTLTKTRPY